MNLTKLALKRPVSCFLVILALAVFGISSIFGFRMELTPDIEMPMLIVMATYPGADPESVDELVASVIEPPAPPRWLWAEPKRLPVPKRA